MSNNTRVKTILILTANPVDTARLLLDKEIRGINEGLQRGKEREQFKLEQVRGVQLKDFPNEISHHQPYIVHFCGHGVGEDGIVLEDDNGQMTLVQADVLADMFEVFASKGVECVVLNACYSEVQAQAISQHINYVIGMNKAVGDETAIKFAVNFYSSLANGYTLEEAYNLTCLINKDSRKYQTSIIKKDSSTTFKTEVIIQTLLKKENPFGLRGRITDPTRFFNREELIRRIFEELSKGSNLSLVGETQIGKSSILSMICQWGTERLQLPSEAFIYIDMQIIHNELEFFEALCEELKIDNCRGYKLARNLRDKHHILCIDEIEKMTCKENFTWNLRSELRGLAGDSDAPLSLVIASRSPLKDLFDDCSNETSPLAGICNQLDVKPFSLETVRKLIQHNLQGTGVVFMESQIQDLFTHSKGHPQRLQEAAAELFRHLTQS
ncbi:CHAT domain-containing protein [Nostocaceae cyanobacterium CENA369]|uniref:CHAT domain-containing protein n=1 Tax=Dendronalium phyllosphericum CENA369 TaxID=1725256 RepID=A0A8J7I7Y9_9NOST|nr:CHAT domain-containing protein [Dendronalium phyllosphericum]MBH8575883.1 CHAT domain-containing protein [Dendronalium phyllosphericum CENA369]